MPQKTKLFKSYKKYIKIINFILDKMLIIAYNIDDERERSGKTL